jgi:hypothetical protein
VTVVFGVPVNVMVAVEPEQIVVEPVIDAVGLGRTVRVMVAVTVDAAHPSWVAIAVRETDPPFWMEAGMS